MEIRPAGGQYIDYLSVIAHNILYIFVQESKKYGLTMDEFHNPHYEQCALEMCTSHCALVMRTNRIYIPGNFDDTQHFCMNARINDYN